MGNKVTCTCGHSWNKSDSSKKDATVCHICGKDNEMENGGWLDKYEQGGMVLKQKTNDNYGKKDNPNNVKVSVGDDYVGLAYDTTGRNYSPAWGGQFEYGGEIAQRGKKIDQILNANKNLDWVKGLYDPNYGSIQIPGQEGRSTHFMESADGRVYPTVRKIDGELKYLGDDAYDYADSTKSYIEFPTDKKAQKFAKNYKRGTGVLGFQQGGSIPGSVGFTYARTGDIPSEGPYAKKTLPSAQNGQEIQYYQEGLDFKPKMISKNGGWLDDYDVPKAQVGIQTDDPNNFPYHPITNPLGVKPNVIIPRAPEEKKYTKVNASSLQTPRASSTYVAPSILPEIKITKEANQPQFSQGRDLYEYEKALNLQRKKNYVNKHPNAQLIDGRIEQRNPDYDLEGKPLTAKGKKQIENAGRVMDVIEAVSLATGVGGIASNATRLGAGLLERSIGRNLISKNIKNFTSKINPYINALDEAAAYVQLDPIGIMGNRLNALNYNPSVALNTVNNTLTGVNRNLTNSGIEAVDLTLGQNNLRNAIDYKIKPLSDKEKEMYEWFEQEERFNKLPETTNKQSIEVLEDFKTRIKTPEGQKRLKELGITEEQLLQDLKIVEDPTNYGYYNPNKNKIAIHPDSPLPKKVTRHEIEHGVQKASKESKINKAIKGTPDEKLKALESGATEIDDILSGLILRKEGTPNKVWNKSNRDIPIDINNYKSLINNRQNATDYFLTGSEGKEKSAFLGEVQQYMMDTGKIPKDSYVQITPEMVQETMVDAMFDEVGGGKYLRLFNIMKADPKNYELISKGLNKMLTVAPVVSLGTALANQPEKKKKGGIIQDDRGQWDHPGKITRINGPDITMKGVPYPVLGIADTGEEQMMYPGQDYNFEGANYVTEYPKGKRPKKAKNSVNQADENSLVQLDQLTNFTNYNKPTKGGWLDKY